MAKLPDKKNIGNKDKDSSSQSIKPKSFKSNSSNSTTKRNRESGIPKQVANRMARRILITSGLPTFLGMGVFIGSYLVVSKGIVDIAPGITLISSALFFLIGLAGLSYGILSTSWDSTPGSLLGVENIRRNIGRVRDAFKGINNFDE